MRSGRLNAPIRPGKAQRRSATAGAATARPAATGKLLRSDSVTMRGAREPVGHRRPAGVRRHALDDDALG